MSDPVTVTTWTPVSFALSAAPAKTQAAPAASSTAQTLVPDPRLTLDPKTHKPVLAYYDPITRRITYIPGSASVDFPSTGTNIEV